MTTAPNENEHSFVELQSASELYELRFSIYFDNKDHDPHKSEGVFDTRPECMRTHYKEAVLIGHIKNKILLSSAMQNQPLKLVNLNLYFDENTVKIIDLLIERELQNDCNVEVFVNDPEPPAYRYKRFITEKENDIQLLKIKNDEMFRNSEDDDDLSEDDDDL